MIDFQGFVIDLQNRLVAFSLGHGRVEQHLMHVHTVEHVVNIAPTVLVVGKVVDIVDFARFPVVHDQFL